jgi:TRAP-type C4-dicarboxylate transport system substrate-binding protein
MKHLVWLAMLVLAIPTLLTAQAPRLQLATMAPAGSVWDKHLKEMITAWQKPKTIAVQIHSGGTLGDEMEVVREMRRPRPTPQIAALTAVGLSAVDPAFGVFGTPFLFNSYDELNFVLDRLRPVLAKRLEDKGLIHIAWGHVGWARVFSTKPVKTLDQLRQLRVWTSGDEDMIQWYRGHGFKNVVVSTMADITLSLNSGKIEAIALSPTVVNSFQWHTKAKFMLDLGIAPIIGAVVVAKPTWDPLPEADRKLFMDAAREMERRLNLAIPTQDQGSIDEMVKRGLITVTKPEGNEWQAEAQSLAKSVESGAADIYAQVLKERDAFRQKKKLP